MPSNNVTVNLNVSVDASGTINVFGYPTQGFSGEEIVANAYLPVSALYDESDSTKPIALIEFWEPSGSLGTMETQLANSSGVYTADLSGAYLESAKRLVNELQRILCNEMDASGAEPFKGNDKYTHPNHKIYKSFGHLALGFYAHHLFGHAAATAAITNDTGFIEKMLSLNAGTVVDGSTTSATMEATNKYKHYISSSLTKDTITGWSNIGSNEDADLARRIVYQIIKKGLDNNNTITSFNTEGQNVSSTLAYIVKQVIGQDASRAMDQDNNVLAPEVHQLLKFMHNDTIYLNIKLTTPNVVFANNTPSTGTPLVNPFNSGKETNYAIRITLKDIKPFETPSTSLATVTAPIPLNTYLENIVQNITTTEKKEQLYTQLQTFSSNLESTIVEVSGNVIVSLLDTNIVQEFSDKNVTVAVPSVTTVNNQQVYSLDVSNVNYDKLYIMTQPGKDIQLIVEEGTFTLTLNENKTITYNSITYSVGQQIPLNGVNYTIIGFGSLMLSKRPVLSYLPEGTPPSFVPINFTNGQTVNLSPTIATTYNNSKTFSIEPALPNGLTLNSSTGVISGTININESITSRVYEILLMDNNNNGVKFKISITIPYTTVPPAQPSLLYVLSQNPNLIPYFSFNNGETITNITPVNANTYNGVKIFSVNPSLPNGLTINTSTGVISGTPNVTSAVITQQYTITLSDDIGQTISKHININITYTSESGGNGGGGGVNPPQQETQFTISYSSPQTYTKGNTITTLVPTVTGGPATSFYLDENTTLPPSLSLDQTTGDISGTVSSISAQATYTIYASKGSGTDASANLVITVNDIPPVISYSSSYLTLTKGTQMIPITPNDTSGGLVVSYDISGTLPSGINFNTSSGTISGTPTEIFSETNYLITATNSGGSTQVSMTIKVNDVIPIVTYPATATFTKDVAITNITPSNVGGEVIAYSIDPQFENGLSFSIATGTISGTPTVLSTATTYTITSYNSGGYDTDTILITVNDQHPIISYSSPQTYTKGTAISTLSPVSTGGAVVTYDISGTLPSGLSFNTTTGEITGTPSVTLATTTYTVTATNSGGSSTYDISITVNDITPSISYSSPQTYNKGIVISTLSPSVSGGATIVSYSVSPALPTGLSLNTSTGAITGTPSVTSGSTSYTVTATNSTGQTGTASVSITVNDATPIISYSSPQTYTKGSAISTLSPSVSGGATISSYSVSPALPIGLSLNTSTGDITGTSTVTSGSTSYTITATNSTGQTGTASVSITVNDVTPIISYSSPQTYNKGTAISTLSPSVSGGATISSYSVSPALPSGLLLNTSTGAITGTPTAVTAVASYTVTATNSTGQTGNTSLSISVNDLRILSGTWIDVSGSDTIRGMRLDNSGNLCVIGFSSSELPSSFVSVLGAKPSTGIGSYLLKYNSSMQLQWGTWIDGIQNDSLFGLSIDSNNNIYVAGQSIAGLQGSITSIIGAKPNAGASPGGFILKYNSSGVLQSGGWIDGVGSETGQSVDVDSNGNIYVSVIATNEVQGSIVSIVGAKPDGSLSQGGLLLKYNSSLVLQWGRWLDVSGSDNVGRVQVDVSNNVYIAGSTNNSFTGSLGTIMGAKPGTGQAGFIVKYDTNGSPLWGRWYDGAGTDNVLTTFIDASGNVYVGGTASAELQGSLVSLLGAKPDAGTSQGAFIIKYDSNGTFLWGRWIDGVGSDSPRVFTTDSSNNIYLVGFSGNEIQGTFVSVIGAKPNGATSQGAFVIKCDTNGNLMTGFWVDGAGTDTIFGIQVDSSNNVYLGGTATNNLQGDITSIIGTKPFASPDQGGFILKYGY